MSSSVPYISNKSEIKDASNSATSKNVSNSFKITDNASDSNYKKNGYLSGSKKPTTSKKYIKSPVKNYRITGAISTTDNINSIMDKLNKTLNIPTSIDTVQNSFIQTAKYYNRFKIANPNMVLQKGFAHVFFVRPSCNLLESSGTNLISSLRNNELFSYAWKSCPDLLKQLSIQNGQSHDFMLSLSNAATSFSLSDEYINADTYGKTYTGYKIAYGKNNIESKTAGNFSVSYNDDRQFHIYQTHRLWVEYINGVYRGEISPLNENIMNKILDYVSAVYYFVTAEDGETILFWTKYYGVFPTTIPSVQYSWASGNVLSNPTIDITYNFSFKEDYNPYTIMEFNKNSNISSNGVTYVSTYDSKLGNTGDTWVGSPFVEVVNDKSADIPYQFKLRFHKKNN